MRVLRAFYGFPLAVLAFIGLLPTPAGALRYVQFDVWLNSKRILRASVGDDGHPTDRATWEYLRRLPLRSMNGYAVHPAQPSQQVMTLKGAIVVESGITEAKVSSLRLVRKNAKAEWQFAPVEIDRLIKLRKRVTVARDPEPG